MRNTVPVLATASRTPASAGPGEHRDALDAAGDGVRGGELLRAFARAVGVSAACDERNGVVAMVAAIESA